MRPWLPGSTWEPPAPWVAPTLVRTNRCYREDLFRTRVGVASDKRLNVVHERYTSRAAHTDNRSNKVDSVATSFSSDCRCHPRASDVDSRKRPARNSGACFCYAHLRDRRPNQPDAEDTRFSLPREMVAFLQFHTPKMILCYRQRPTP